MNEQQTHDGAPEVTVPSESSGRSTHDNLFGSDRRPFEDRPDAAFSFLTPELEETFAAVEYEIRFGKGAMLVVGEAGLGKTQFVRAMLPRLSARDHAAVLTWPASGQRDLMRETCKAFGVSVSSSRGNDNRRVSRLERHLSRHSGDETRNVLFIDQAENLNTKNLSQLTALTELESDGAKLLTVVLTTQPHLVNTLDEPQHARLKQRLFGERVLMPLTETQTARYIRHRLNVAGVADPDMFEPDAIKWIHQRAGGVPRLINHLCRQAMLAAYGADESTITLGTLVSIGDPGVTQERSMDVESLGLGGDEPYPGAGRPFDVVSEHSDHSDSTGGFHADEGVAALSSDDGDTFSVADELDSAYATTGGIARHPEEQAVLGSMDSLFVRGEALLNRLERALARADRMAATSESTYAQNKAVETHLEALSNRAERLIGSLSKTAPDVVRTLSNASRQIETIEKARSEGERVEAKLVSTAKRIAEKADDVQDRIAQLMQGLNEGQSVESRITVASRGVAEVNAACDQRVERLSELLGETDKRIAQVHEAIQGKAIDTVEEKIRAATQTGIESIHQIEQRVLQARQSIAETSSQFEEFESTCRDRILDMCQSTIKDQRAAFQRALHEVAEAARRSIDDACARASEFAADTESRVRTLHTTCETPIQNLEQRAAGILTTTENLEERAKTLQDALDSMGDRAMSTVERLTETARSGEGVLDALSEERGRGEQTQRSLAKSIARIDDFAQCARNAENQAAVCERLTKELADKGKQTEALLYKLDESTTRGQDAHTEIDAVLALATDQTHRLGSHNAAASMTLKELSSATIHGRSVVDSLKNSVESTKELMTRAQAQIETLTTVDADRQETSRRLGLLVQAAHKLDAALSRRLERAGDSLKSLTVQSENAHHTHARITEVTEKGDDLIERAERTIADLGDSMGEKTEHIEHLLEDLWSLNANANSTADRLKTDVARGEQTVSALTGNLAPAEKVRDELGTVINSAAIRAAELAGREGTARELLAQWETISEKLESAREWHESVAPMVDEARSLCAELTTTGADTRQQSIELNDLHRLASDMTQKQTELNDETDSIINTLGDQIKTAQACAESSESILKDFVERAEELETQVTDLDAKSRKIHESVAAALAQPERIVEQAREQGDKLSRVSEAVRKVSTGLAQTTLEAKRHLEALARVNQEAAQRLSAVATLSGSTRRATESLREWVEQSNKVQGQMEWSNGEPGAPEQLVPADRSVPPSRIAHPQGIGARSDVGALNRLRTTAPATAAATRRQPVGATPASAENAAEIAKLIDESRRQAGIDKPRA